MSKTGYLLAFSMSIFFLVFTMDTMAEDPPPPPPGGGHGQFGNGDPMGAPIEDGLAVFLGFASLLIGYKLMATQKSHYTASLEKGVITGISGDNSSKMNVPGQVLKSKVQFRRFFLQWKQISGIFILLFGTRADCDARSIDKLFRNK
jgi:hypothetical protein